MQKFLSQFCFILFSVLFLSCTSGNNNPADSHPGSGSVKAGDKDRDIKNKTDTASKDTTDGKSKAN
jgi:hypothetical protein